MPFTRIAATTLALALSSSAVFAASSPIPGGANQVNAVTGKLGDTLWNGVLRFKLIEVRDATPADHPETVVPLASQKVIVISALIRNGTPSTWSEVVNYTLADKDDVAFEVPGHFFTPVAVNIAQGAAVKQTALVPIDKSFVPVKLIFQCSSCGKSFKAFRVLLPPPAQ
jgi:hypothetical protein